jgi:hypothetical protein
MRKTYAEEYPHCAPALLEAVYIRDDSCTNRKPTSCSERLQGTPDHERRYALRGADADRADEENWMGGEVDWAAAICVYQVLLADVFES